MFTKAEVICGASGFLIILGMLIIAPASKSLLGLLALWTGIGGIIVSTKLHESD